MPTDPKPRRFRFSLRTLFVVVTMTLVVGAWLGWNVRVVSERNALADWIQAGHGSILFDQHPRNMEVWRVGSLSSRVRQMMGERSVRLIWTFDTTPAMEERLNRVFPEAEIDRGAEAYGLTNSRANP